MGSYSRRDLWLEFFVAAITGESAADRREAGVVATCAAEVADAALVELAARDKARDGAKWE